VFQQCADRKRAQQLVASAYDGFPNVDGVPMKHLPTTLKAALGAALLSLAGAASAVIEPPLRTIAALDVPRYMGTWYEIAKFPNFFQRKCVSDTTANYSLGADGRVQVLNRCREQDGTFEQATAAARQLGGPTSPKLEVRFAPKWLSFVPGVWADYWVIDLDDGYQLAAVSGPTRKYLWVLSRTPTVDPAAYAALLVRLRAQGFDTQALVPTAHTAGSKTIAALE
jgi:apolipoprotein D and lipocalin family protein